MVNHRLLKPKCANTVAAGCLKTFLRIPSVSTLPEHRDDIDRAARFVADSLGAAGMEHVEIISTAKHPLVYADWMHAPGKPTAQSHRTASSPLFLRADTNKDGMITRAEYDAAVAAGKIKTRHANMRGSAIVRLFDANYADVLAYAVRRCPSRQDAEDLVAETFAVAWRRLRDVPEGDRARLWLFGTARLVRRNQDRARRRQRSLAEKVGSPG